MLRERKAIITRRLTYQEREEENVTGSAGFLWTIMSFRRESVERACRMPTLVGSLRFIVETPLPTNHLVYSRHVDTNVYVSPAKVFSKSTSIIHVVIVDHLLSCRDHVVCCPQHLDRHAAILSSECFFLFVIMQTLS